MINRLFLFVVLLSAFFFSSCNPEDPEPTTPPTVPASQYYLRATIGGQYYPGSTTMDPEGYYDQDDEYYLLLGGDAEQSVLLAMSILDGFTVGQSYPFEDIEEYGIMIFQPNDSAHYTMSTGTFTVTSHDTQLKILTGTFSGTLTHDSGTLPDLAVTGGEFKVRYN